MWGAVSLSACAHSLERALTPLCFPGAGRSAQDRPVALQPAPRQVSPDPVQPVCFWQQHRGEGLVRFPEQPVVCHLDVG